MTAIKLIHDDITKVDCDAIVNPANSHGYMGGGVAEALKVAGGNEIEDEAIDQAPIPLGMAIVTSAGMLRAQMVIHSPTMEQPGGRATLATVEEATEAALQVAEEQDVHMLAMPGMGTGIGNLELEAVAEVMADVIARHTGISTLMIVDLQLPFLACMEKALQKRGLLRAKINKA